MALVLDAFASYLSDLLTQVTGDEVGMLLGVSDEIDKMCDKLQDLKNFLADADRRNITDKSVQEWVGQLKRAMYDATDILDLCQLKAMERGASTVDMGCFNPLLFCLRNPLHAHEIGTRIKALNQRLDAIKELSTAFNFINHTSYDDPGSRVAPSTIPNRETSWELDLPGVVGEKIEEDTRKLVKMMLTKNIETSNNTTVPVVAIVGVGGIGKTTLAQKVFNDEAIKNKFDTKIWLSVSMDFDKAELLRTAIDQAGGDHRGQKAIATLLRTLTAVFTGKKLLLVMDDMWSRVAWSDVLEIPFVRAAAPGSGVLVTTRDERVAREMKAVLPYHHIDKLDAEDAWSLLKKQAVSSEMDELDIDKLKDIGLKIIKKCDGLPLAVKVVGGLLRSKGMLRGAWEQVLEDSVWSTFEMPQELYSAIYLSYEDLPPHMKQCFLYYSFLPEHKSFHVNTIVAMWISEGFIHGNSNDLEQLGKYYYEELISRNLIEPDKWSIDQQYCRMHDTIRSFAQYVARDEAFISHNGEVDICNKLNSQKFRWLSIGTQGLQSGELEWRSLQEQKSVRTLIIVGQIKMKPGDSLATFSSLRTLHIEYGNIAALVKSLHQLKHLRYLALEQTDISALPRNIGKMKLLQHINLTGCRSLVELPHSIVKLGHLRYLNLNGIINVDIPKGFRGLTNMRTLIGFRAHMDGNWCSLEELGPLSQLRLLGMVQLENVSTTSSAANANLGEKMHLTDIFLSCSSRLGDDGLVKEKEGVPEEEQRRIENVFDELCPPPSIEFADIRGYFGHRLPKWMMSTAAVALNSLKFLKIYDLACCTKLSDGFCQLPWLQHLEIHRAPSIKKVGPEFLRPPQRVAAFPKLNKMILDGMVEWEEWEWKEQVQAFPHLGDLLLQRCKLRCVPPGLASNASALKKLCVEYVQHLNCLENFTSIVELEVTKNPDLERITHLSNLQKLKIDTCPKLKLLEGVRELQSLILEDYNMETLPKYLRGVNQRHLELRCSLTLLISLAAGQSGPEWDKFSHVDHVKAYAHDGDVSRKWYMLYTRDPYNLDTNIRDTSMLAVPVGKDKHELFGKNENQPFGSKRSSESADDELIGTDIASGSTVPVGKDKHELFGKNENQSVGSNRSSESADDKLAGTDIAKLAGTDIAGGSTVPVGKDKHDLFGKNENQPVGSNRSSESTDDKLVGTNIASGSAVPIGKDKHDFFGKNENQPVGSNRSSESADDELVGTDIASGSADKHELFGKNENQPVGSNKSSESAALCKDDVLVGTDIASGSAVPVGKDKHELFGKNENQPVGSKSSESAALRKDDELVGTDIGSGSAVAFCKDDHELVGIDGQCDNIIKFLMHGEARKQQIVSICGIAGLGKTTVAKAVYRKIIEQFDRAAFVSVSPDPDITKVIRSILDQVGCRYTNVKEHGIQQPLNELREYLQDKKYLLVVDDIWNASVWDSIKPALIDNNRGSRIITTTRKVDVAEYIGGVYERLLLSYDDCKTLFYKRTEYGSEDFYHNEFRELSQKILNKCSQLPLAVIAIASLLSDKDMGLEKWKKVCNSFGSGLQIGEAVEDMRNVVKRSYDHLPPDIQNCLLSLSIFPEDCIIGRDCLVRRWVSEDIIQGEHARALQEVGESYFDELVNASMIKPIEFDRFGSVVAFCVPVIVLDLIMSLSLKENSVAIISEQQGTDLPKKVKRLSIQVCSEQHPVPKATKIVQQVTSLSIFCGADLMRHLTKFLGLHVLDLGNCDSLQNDHLKYLWNLVKLRHLALGSSHITVIPQKIEKLERLHTLDLTATSVEQLPSSVVKLTQLRHLLINRKTKVPAGIGKLQALEELVDIDISKSPGILEDISTMPELRVLSIALWSWDESNSRLFPEVLPKLSTKRLKHLSIFSCCLVDFKSDLQPVLQELEKLEIQGSTFNKLPDWIGQLTKLRSLSIEVYSLEWDALRILGKLSGLLFLSLAAKRTPGEKLVVASDEFSSLKAFLLFSRDMAIKFEQGAMKGLQRLKLTLQASVTEDFGFGLENLSSLKHVQVEIICFSATDWVVQRAESDIESMIVKNPNNPTLEITRTVGNYMIAHEEEDLR